MAAVSVKRSIALNVEILVEFSWSWLFLLFLKTLWLSLACSKLSDSRELRDMKEGQEKWLERLQFLSFGRAWIF